LFGVPYFDLSLAEMSQVDFDVRLKKNSDDYRLNALDYRSIFILGAVFLNNRGREESGWPSKMRQIHGIEFLLPSDSHTISCFKDVQDLLRYPCWWAFWQRTPSQSPCKVVLTRCPL
jgi:hypothetical protein